MSELEWDTQEERVVVNGRYVKVTTRTPRSADPAFEQFLKLAADAQKRDTVAQFCRRELGPGELTETEPGVYEWTKPEEAQP
jgi:hypothetical protein